MEPVRILHIVPNMQAGGLETFIMNVYRNIDRRELLFDFLVHYEKRCFYDDEIEALGGRIYRLSLREDYNFFKYIRNLNSFFKSHPEYKIVHGHMASLSVFYLTVAKINGVKVRICHSHNTAAEKSLKGIVIKILSKFGKQCANVRFACSTKAGEYLYGHKPFTVIPNAINTKTFGFNRSTRTWRRNELKLDGKLVIGHVGRFEPQKNHSFLIEIFNEVQLRRPDSILMLIGGGKLMPVIDAMVSDLGLKGKVEFMGVRADVHELYQAMDVFVLPSFYEGLPVVIVEAQCAGLPVIVSEAVTEEARLSNKYWAVSLQQSAAYWGDVILEASNETRDLLPGEMTGTRFDINNAAAALTTFYLKYYREIGEHEWQYT